MSETPHSSQVAAFKAKIEPVRFGMLTTVDQHGHLTSQPMTKQQVDDDGGLWFYTSSMTDLWENIGARPKVNVSFAEPADHLYVSISGTAERIVERARIRALWNPMVATWFPNGVDDPHLVLVRVAAHTVHYWNAHDNSMTEVFAIAKAAISGSPAAVTSGEHGQMTL